MVEEGKKCQHFPFGNKSMPPLVYGPCNTNDGNNYCECRTPFRWVSIPNGSWNRFLSKEERSFLNPATRKCAAMGDSMRCCMGRTNRGFSKQNCNGMGEYMQHFDVGRPLFDSVDVLQLPSVVNGSRITFFGDSLTEQIYNGFLCDLQRSGADLSKGIVMARIGGASLRIMDSVATISLPNRRTKEVHLAYYRQYQLRSKGMTIKEACKISNILVWGLGHHYHRVSNFQNMLRMSFPLLKLHCMDQGVKVIFRGNMAMHFQRPEGMYFPTRLETSQQEAWYNSRVGIAKSVFSKPYNRSLDKHPKVKCAPLRYMNYRMLYNWRSRITVEELMKHNLTLRLPPWGTPTRGVNHCKDRLYDAYFIPVGEITASLWEWHPTGLECSHWCHTPLLFSPIWDAMYHFIKCGLKQERQHSRVNFTSYTSFHFHQVPNRFFIKEFIDPDLRKIFNMKGVHHNTTEFDIMGDASKPWQ